MSYTWSPAKNNCDAQCNIANTVPICNNQNNQALVDSWRAAGKKVILSFGGAGMGGSWSGTWGGEDMLGGEEITAFPWDAPLPFCTP